MELNINEIINLLDMTEDWNQCYYLPELHRFVWVDDTDRHGSFDIDNYDGDFFALPSKKEINEYRIMKSFADDYEGLEAREWLQNSLIGKGAFRRFRATCERFMIEDEWFDYRDRALENIAVTWCEENGLPFTYRYFEEDEKPQPKKETKKTNNARIIDINQKNAYAITYLVADFRVYLSSLKGIKEKPDLDAAGKEIDYYLSKGYPVYAVSENGRYQGYAVCRIEDDVVWMESLYVRDSERRRHFGKMLLDKCEETARQYGNDTLYIFIHPNNELMISFLHNSGYDVLNLLEVRKPHEDEKTETSYQIGEHNYRY